MSEHIQSLSGGRQPPESSHTPGADAPRSEEHQRTPGVAHESEAFDFWLIVWVGVGLAVICLVIQIALWGLLGRFEKSHTVPPEEVSSLAKEDADRPLGQRVDAVPGPRLEGIEGEKNRSSIAAARQQAEGRMKSYGWIDRQKEIVHVPIDKAIDEILRTKELDAPNNKKKAAGGKR